MSVELITAIIGSGAFMSVLTFMFTRKKTTAESVILNLDAFNKALETWQSVADSLKTQLYSSQKEMELLRTENAHLLAQLADMTFNMVRLEREIDATKTVNSMLMNKMTELNNSNEALRVNIEQLRNENMSLRKQIATLNRKLSE
jgi:septal ring factor EnvC (AmiA/AmiB activator)